MNLFSFENVILCPTHTCSNDDVYVFWNSKPARVNSSHLKQL